MRNSLVFAYEEEIETYKLKIKEVNAKLKKEWEEYPFICDECCKAFKFHELKYKREEYIIREGVYGSHTYSTIVNKFLCCPLCGAMIHTNGLCISFDFKITPIKNWSQIPDIDKLVDHPKVTGPFEFTKTSIKRFFVGKTRKWYTND